MKVNEVVEIGNLSKGSGMSIRNTAITFNLVYLALYNNWMSQEICIRLHWATQQGAGLYAIYTIKGRRPDVV